MKEKVSQNGKQPLCWQSYILIGVGVLLGIVMVSLIKHQGIHLNSIGRATVVAILMFIIYFLILKGAKKAGR